MTLVDNDATTIAIGISLDQTSTVLIKTFKVICHSDRDPYAHALIAYDASGVSMTKILRGCHFEVRGRISGIVPFKIRSYFTKTFQM
jgi:hypothetical protein